jgi:hypothetical protein
VIAMRAGLMLKKSTAVLLGATASVETGSGNRARRAAATRYEREWNDLTDTRMVTNVTIGLKLQFVAADRVLVQDDLLLGSRSLIYVGPTN